jgi:hypothetical protein
VSDKIEEFFRDATGFDVARVMRGERVEARFRDGDREDWREGEFLGGFHRGNCEEFEWKDLDGVPWQQCQIYDPQEWFLNKPEPGEGYRLLEKFPPEPKLATDEVWRLFKTWETTANDNGVQEEDCWYRRRIETKPTQCVERVCNLAKPTGVTCPHDSCDLETGVRIANSPAILDSSRSRDKIPSGWRVLSKDEERLASDAYWSLGCKEWIVIGDGRVEYANDLPRWHAIRQVEYYVDCVLVSGVRYKMPDGKEILVAEKGFEVL